MTITRETPGVYIEEITGPGVIQGVSTSIAAFVGPSATGRSDAAVAVTTFDQFMERFASVEQPHLYDAATGTPYFLSFALQGFFQNGGQRAHIARVTNGAAASAELTNTQGGVEAIVRARSEGTWGDAITRRRAAELPDVAARCADGIGGGAGIGHAAGRVPGRTARVSSSCRRRPPASSRATRCRSCSHRRRRSWTTRATSRRRWATWSTCWSCATSGTGGALTFAANGLPAGLAIDNTPAGSPARSTTAGQSAVSVQVTDGPQSTTVDFDWVVDEPVPLVTSPGTQQTRCGRGRQPPDPGPVAGQPARGPHLRRQRPAGRARHGRAAASSRVSRRRPAPTRSRSPSPRGERAAPQGSPG